VIYKWLAQNDRLLDKKYLAGESYVADSLDDRPAVDNPHTWNPKAS